MINRLISIDTNVYKEGKLTFENPILKLSKIDLTRFDRLFKQREIIKNARKQNQEKIKGVFYSANN